MRLGLQGIITKAHCSYGIDASHGVEFTRCGYGTRSTLIRMLD